MVWYGMVWYGMAWHSMAWYGMVLVVCILTRLAGSSKHDTTRKKFTAKLHTKTSNKIYMYIGVVLNFTLRASYFNELDIV